MLAFWKTDFRPHLLVFAPLWICSFAQAETWIITDHNNPVSNRGRARVIRLDEQQRLEETLTSKLPADLTHAPATIQAYLSRPDGMKLQQQLAIAQQGVADAWSTGVEKIPAVVVDRRYVVYGETDVRKAIEKIKAYRSAER